MIALLDWIGINYLPILSLFLGFYVYLDSAK
jgi:hypothetical protein